MRTELTKRERTPYAIRSLSPLIIGGDAGVWPIAGAAVPNKPPTNAALPFRNSLRADRFEPIGLSFAMSLTENRVAKAYARLGRIVKIIGMSGWGKWVEPGLTRAQNLL